MTTSGLGLSIAVLAFGASTIYLAVQLGKERAHSEQLATETRALNARIGELEKARAEPRVAMSGVFSAINTQPGESVSVTLPPPSTATRTEARADMLESVVVNGPSMQPSSEAFRKIIRSQMRAQNKQLYADIGAQLGLSKEDASKLIDLLTDQHVDGMGISRETTDPNERMRLMNEARRENQAKIADLLGPEKLKQLEQYQQTIPARQEMDMLARQIEGSDADPLSSDQRKQLLAALIEERSRIPAPDYRRIAASEDFRKAYLDWQDDYNARIAAQARGILDAEQYAAYDQHQQWQKEMNEQMRSAVGPSGVTLPAAFVGETAVLTLTAPDEKPDKEP